jgi:hypothetical protein
MYSYMVYTAMGRRLDDNLSQEEACRYADEIGGYVTLRQPADNWCGYTEQGVYVTIACQITNPIAEVW